MGGRTHAAAAAKVGEIQNMDMAALIEFVRDESAAKKFMNEFNTKLAEFRAVVQAQADIDQTQTLLAAAKTDRANATKALAQAKEQTAAATKEAKAALDRATASANEAAKAADADRKEAARAIDKAKATAGKLVKDAQAELATAAADRDRAGQDRKQAAVLKKGFLDKRVLVDAALKALAD